MKPCKDCDVTGIPEAKWRPTPHPGPRCVTHWRAVKKARSLAAHGKRVESTYGLTPDQYWALYQWQGGKCFVCGKATGRARRLAVDHDHQLAIQHGHDPKTGCPECVRMLGCGPCNRDVLGRLDVAALQRAIIVLTDPPARRFLASRIS